jgi:predicted ribosomally synthesized peptide with SipW-like signal peptide
MVVSLLGALVGGGLFAYFSDTETSENNTFTAGTIDIDLTGGGNVGGIGVDFKPCEWGTLEHEVINSGLNPIELWKIIENPVSDENGTNEPELLWYDTYNGGVARNIAPSDLTYDLTVELYDPDGSGGWTLVNTRNMIPMPGQPLENYIDVPQLLTDDTVGIAAQIEPGQKVVIIQSFHLEDIVDDWGQTDILHFDETYYASQIGGSGP